MNSKIRKILILLLFLLSISPVLFLIPHFPSLYTTLEKYYVHGLGVCWLGAYILANLCAPFFMQNAGSRTDYENSGPRGIATLYYSVMMITFLALVVVFFGLWCLGWLLELIKLLVYWIVSYLVERLVDIFTFSTWNSFYALV